MDWNKLSNATFFFAAALVLISTTVWCLANDLAGLGVRSETQRVGLILVGLGGATWASFLGFRQFSEKSK